MRTIKISNNQIFSYRLTSLNEINNTVLLITLNYEQEYIGTRKFGLFSESMWRARMVSYTAVFGQYTRSKNTYYKVYYVIMLHKNHLVIIRK